MSDMQRKIAPGHRRPSQEWTVFLQVAISGVVHAGDRLTTTVPVVVVSRVFARGASAGAPCRAGAPC